jgi:hypothetical protein
MRVDLNTLFKNNWMNFNYFLIKFSVYVIFWFDILNV